MEKLLKVCRTAQGKRYTNKIQISGDWLKKYGFQEDDLVKVAISQNEIKITKNKSTNVLTAFNVKNPELMRLIDNLDLSL